MTAIKHIELKLVQQFQNRETFSRDELFHFFQAWDPDLKEGTLAWRIHDLKRKQIIKDVKKGIYTLEHKQDFRPEPDPIISQLSSFMENSTNHQFYNVWTTAWLNELIELQATSFLYILEVDKDSMQSVFFSLKDEGTGLNLFFKPDEKVIETYISELSEAIIVEPMISRAPVMKVKGIIFPTLEKILVDLLCEEKLFFAYQGQQLVKIYEACLDKYSINFSRLFNYAKRRKRDEALKSFLMANNRLHEKIKEIIE
ncbi:MAG TPA: DUF6577 family protein [Flavisolibacter sp.]|nr:DUF6577 family protein [Flavisolibacter sp.]